MIEEIQEQARQILFFEAAETSEQIAFEALVFRLTAIYEAGYNKGKEEQLLKTGESK